MGPRGTNKGRLEPVSQSKSIDLQVRFGMYDMLKAHQAWLRNVTLIWERLCRASVASPRGR